MKDFIKEGRGPGVIEADTYVGSLWVLKGRNQICRRQIVHFEA